jgi:hypothetical protein
MIPIAITARLLSTGWSHCSFLRSLLRNSFLHFSRLVFTKLLHRCRFPFSFLSARKLSHAALEVLLSLVSPSGIYRRQYSLEVHGSIARLGIILANFLFARVESESF